MGQEWEPPNKNDALALFLSLKGVKVTWMRQLLRPYHTATNEPYCYKETKTYLGLLYNNRS